MGELCRGKPAGVVARWPGMELTCPKCHGSMRSYERVGILIDQCSECRGVYLDRGELEKLIDAEAGSATAGSRDSAAPAWGTPEPRRERHDDGRYDGRYDTRHDGDDWRHDRRYGDPRYRGKRKKSFLEELFD
jgi:uncharacterized protein